MGNVSHNQQYLVFFMNHVETDSIGPLFVDLIMFRIAPRQFVYFAIVRSKFKHLQDQPPYIT